MTADQILSLARSYAQFQGLTLRRVGVLAANNPILFHRLAAGKDARTRTVERAASWLSHHWPRGMPWPEGVPEPPPYRPGASTVDRRSTGGEGRAGGLVRSGAPGRDIGA